MDENQMMTEGVTMDKGELSSERECDVSIPDQTDLHRV